ncbi:MAG TPA: hypothetical protein VM146_18255 [Steroidobacteraceae bacterium]|nr:hypothetical protein [Steroidobacteraceae bacterium]
MKSVIMACVTAGVLVTGCASDTRPVVVGQKLVVPATTDYCTQAQKEIASARVPSRNVVVADFQSFAARSPSVQPLETLQFVQYADPQRTKPRMISCKLHSAEKIRSAYGANAAGESTTCARLNRRTLDAVMATLTERQKKKMPFKGTIPILLDPDEQSANEAQWLESFTMVQTDAGGTLRVRAKSLRGDANQRVSTRPATGGRQYCHLIAPDYLKRILLGEVQLPAAEFPDAGRTVSR